MEDSEETEYFYNIRMILDNLREDDVLQDFINTEESRCNLICYLELKRNIIIRNLSEKTDFSISEILNTKEGTPLMKKYALYWALMSQKTDKQFIVCLEWFNEKLSRMNSNTEDMCDRNNILELYYIIEVIMKVKHTEDIYKYINVANMKKLLFKFTNMKLNDRCYVNMRSIFFYYFDQIVSGDSHFIDDMLVHLITNENLEFFIIMFNEKLSTLSQSLYFHKEELWNFIRCHINGDSSTKKKQALYILHKTIEFFKLNCSNIVPEALRSQSLNDWDLWFVLLDISDEKQLHLLQPMLKLLPSIANLKISWQLCLYKLLLCHSQLFVVYTTIEYILQLKFVSQNEHQELLRHVLVALNKHEYCNLSQHTYNELTVFCTKLDENCCIMMFKEFLKIEWNPVAAWCILESSSCILHKIPRNIMQNVITTLKHLPNTFIRTNCIMLFLQNILDNSTHEILEDIVEIGKILLFNDLELDTSLFHAAVERNKSKLEVKKTQLIEKVFDSIDEKNEKHLFVYLELIKLLNFSFNFVTSIPNSSIGDIMLYQFPNILQNSDAVNHVIQRIKTPESNDYRFLSKYLKTFPISRNKLDDLIISDDNCLMILSSAKNCDSKMTIAIQVIYQTVGFSKLTELVDLVAKENYQGHSKYVIHELWLKEFKSIAISYTEEEFSRILEKFQIMIDLDDEKLLYLVVENLELLTNYTMLEDFPICLYLYDQCLKKICELPTTLLKLYSIVFFRSVFDPKLFSCQEFIEYFRSWNTLFEDYFLESESVLKVVMEGCRKIILLDASNADILIPLVLKALYNGIIVQKNQRVEYEICQDIYMVMGEVPMIQNPNIVKMEIKMLAVESLYLLANSRSAAEGSMKSDKLILVLLDLYKQHHKARYFPDSKTHCEKLRTVQMLILLVNLANESKKELVQFILNSFNEESHQVSVKLILQWLLIILSSNTCNHLNVMIEHLNIEKLSSPSLVISLIPVLYHLALLSKDIELWYIVTDALLPLMMGANFKLRVYAQITLEKLLKKAEERQLTDYVWKYLFVKKAISKILKASANAVDQTLKHDLMLMDSFDPILNYSMSNTFINFPRILDVAPAEWKNISEFKFSHKFDIKIEDESRYSSLGVIKNDETESDVYSSGTILQKKIIPWRSALEDMVANKTMGDLICVASLLEKAANLGGLARTCEVFSIKQLALHNIKSKETKEFKSLSMSSENWVNLLEVKRDDLFSFLSKMKQQDYTLVALEQTSESKKLNEFEFSKKVVLLLGNEKEGIPAPLLSLMDSCVEIPQFGQTRSLNVHVAASTFIWEYVRQQLS